MLIPMWKNLIVPYLFNRLIVDRSFVILFQLDSSCLPSLNQNRSQIVDPFSSFFCGSCLQIKSSMFCCDSEAKRVEVVWYFIFLHHRWANSQSQVSNIVNQQKSRSLIFGRVTNPLNFSLILAKKDPPLDKLIRISTALQEDMSFDELFTDFNSFFDVRNSEVFQPTIYGSKVVSFCGKLFFSYSFIDVGQVLLANGRTRPSSVGDELLHRHLLFLFGIVCVCS